MSGRVNSINIQNKCSDVGTSSRGSSDGAPAAAVQSRPRCPKRCAKLPCAVADRASARAPMSPASTWRPSPIRGRVRPQNEDYVAADAAAALRRAGGRHGRTQRRRSREPHGGRSRDLGIRAACRARRSELDRGARRRPRREPGRRRERRRFRSGAGRAPLRRHGHDARRRAVARARHHLGTRRRFAPLPAAATASCASSRATTRSCRSSSSAARSAASRRGIRAEPQRAHARRRHRPVRRGRRALLRRRAGRRLPAVLRRPDRHGRRRRDRARRCATCGAQIRVAAKRLVEQANAARRPRQHLGRSSRASSSAAGERAA